MPYEDNLFLRMSPAGIIARVAASDPSLAIVSALSISEQVRIGWIGNPAVERLYELTSAGVWIARTDASGRITESNSGSISTSVASVATYEAAGGWDPTIQSAAPASATAAGYMHRKIGILAKAFTSNAGGTLDASVDAIAALAGYYGMLCLRKIKASQNVVAGATLVFHDGDNNLIYTLTLPALTANVPQDLGDLYIFLPALTDNKSIHIDSTSHDLGNATVFDLEYFYHWET